MSARRVVTLLCDKPRCREHYVGGDGMSTAQVRAEAAKLCGWTSARGYDGTYDLCRWHS